MENINSSRLLGTGFMLGITIGLLIGFLYAPGPGEETREIIKEKADEVKVKASGIVEKAKEKAVEVRRQGEEKLGKERA